MIDKDLIDKFYQGECSETEARQVLNWFEDRQKGEEYIESLWNNDADVNSRTVEDASHTFNAIRQQINTEEAEKNHYLLATQWIKVAAILVLAIMLPLLLIHEETPSNTTYVEVDRLITKENPSGRKSVIYLPDGSVVNLNAKSSIRYPEGFKDSIRSVFLVGEAFFEVAENKSKPFIVSAAGVDTRALGTSFNVKAYEEDASVQVVLASGKVKVSQPKERDSTEVFLNPGEEAYVEKQTSAILKRQADLYSTLAWKDNIIVFQQAPAKQVFATLERWYGVEFILPDGFFIDSWSFTGEFEDDNLENVLLSISYVKNFQYQINQKSIIITP